MLQEKQRCKVPTGSFPATGRASSTQICHGAGRRNGALALQRGTRGRRSTARRASSPTFKNLPSKSTNTYTGRHQSVFSAFIRTSGNTRSASEGKNEDTRLRERPSVSQGRQATAGAPLPEPPLASRPKSSLAGCKDRSRRRQQEAERHKVSFSLISQPKKAEFGRDDKTRRANKLFPRVR